MDDKKKDTMSNNNNSPISSSNRFDELAITAEARRLQSLRNQDLRDQDHFHVSAASLRYPKSASLPMASSSYSRPPVNSLSGSSSLLNDSLSCNDLDLALRLARQRAATTTPPSRPNPFGRDSFLPHGPSYMNNALSSIPPNESLVAHLSLLPTRAASLLSAASSTSTPARSNTNCKRKRESTFDPRQTSHDSSQECKKEEITSTLPPRKRLKHQSSSFPLPLLHEAQVEQSPDDIPLKSYSNLWESLDGQRNHETFRKYIHNNQVSIQVDTSVTGRYSS